MKIYFILLLTQCTHAHHGNAKEHLGPKPSYHFMQATANKISLAVKVTKKKKGLKEHS